MVCLAPAHSILNSEGLMRGSGLLDSILGRYYRLIYSVLAVITLLDDAELAGN
jgi:hypothetical protein